MPLGVAKSSTITLSAGPPCACAAGIWSEAKSAKKTGNNQVVRTPRAIKRIAALSRCMEKNASTALKKERVGAALPATKGEVVMGDGAILDGFMGEGATRPTQGSVEDIMERRARRQTGHPVYALETNFGSFFCAKLCSRQSEPATTKTRRKNKRNNRKREAL